MGQGHQGCSAEAAVIWGVKPALMTSSASIGLHTACGFELVGIEREVGRKFGRWLDVVLMQRLL